MGDRYNQIYSYILYSVVLGFGFGALYDFFRIIRMAFCVPGIIKANRKNNGVKYSLPVNIIVFICDILFFLCAACITVIFVFHANNGNIRGIALTGSLIGFIIYYNTVGRLVTMVAAYIIKAVYYFAGFILRRIFIPLLKLVYNAFAFAIALLVGLDAYLYTQRSKRRIIHAAKRGFK